MASSGKKKTTMAKLSRESRLRERRLDKQARKDARKQAPALHTDAVDGDDGESALEHDATDGADDQPASGAIVAP